MMPARRVIRALSSVALLLVEACAWSSEPTIPEENIAFFFRSNLPCVRGEVNGRDATLVIASALPRTAISSSLKGNSSGARLLLGSTFITRVKPTALDLPEIPADGFLGADALRGKIATIDYFRGLLVVSAWPKARPEVTPWDFSGGPPRVPVRINGRVAWAIVDSALPDTAVIPSDFIDSAPRSRATVTLEVAGVRFNELDVAVMPGVAPRIGNRVLARFVVTIDYAREKIGLWPDPRTVDALRR